MKLLHTQGPRRAPCSRLRAVSLLARETLEVLQHVQGLHPQSARTIKDAGVFIQDPRRAPGEIAAGGSATVGELCAGILGAPEILEVMQHVQGLYPQSTRTIHDPAASAGMLTHGTRGTPCNVQCTTAAPCSIRERGELLQPGKMLCIRGTRESRSSILCASAAARRVRAWPGTRQQLQRWLIKDVE